MQPACTHRRASGCMATASYEPSLLQVLPYCLAFMLVLNATVWLLACRASRC